MVKTEYEFYVKRTLLRLNQGSLLVPMRPVSLYNPNNERHNNP